MLFLFCLPDIEDNLDDDDDFTMHCSNPNYPSSSYPDAGFLSLQILLDERLLSVKISNLESQLDKYNCLVECISGKFLHIVTDASAPRWSSIEGQEYGSGIS